MKTLTTIAMLSLVLLIGCGRGHPGEAGPAGERGPAGAAGRDGVDAAMSAYAVTEVVDPCGDAAGIVDEVLLKLASGQVLASFSDSASGQNTRFSILPAGSYITTDGSACHFTLSASGTISY